MSKNTEIALFGGKSNDVPAHLQQRTGPSLGNENTSASDYAMPQIKLLQALSPECRSVPGAKEGMLYNSVTGELASSLWVVNLYFNKEYAVFKQRTKGGGFFGNFDTQSDAEESLATLDGDASDYEIVETDKHYLLLLDTTGKPIGPAVVFMSSTKQAVSKEWNSQISILSQGQDRFSRAWELGSYQERNKRGQEFANFTITDLGFIQDPELYKTAEDAYYAVSGTPRPSAAA